MGKSRRFIHAAFLFCIFILAPLTAQGAAPGVTERSGERVPLEAAFTDESGSPVTLGALVDRPTILSFAYFRCEDICNTVLSNLAGAIARTAASPGVDFRVLTVSFDDGDGPKDALYKKRNYTMASGRGMDEGAWRFLTGTKASIEALTGAAGFGFAKTDKGFDHPGALVVLSADGMITRYVYGSSYLPAELDMAVSEAGRSTIGASIKRALAFCFSDEPSGRIYVRGALKAVGVATLVFVSGLFIYLTASRRPDKRDPE